MVKGRTVPDVELLTEKVQLRCDRGAGLARTLKLRRALLRSAVVSLIAWAGPWQQYAKAPTKKWVSAVDNALWEGRAIETPGHSVVGSADSNVDFNLALDTLVGTFIPGHHTLAAVKTAAKQAWLQEVWDIDVRTGHSGPLAGLWGAGLPSLAHCRKWLI